MKQLIMTIPHELDDAAKIDEGRPSLLILLEKECRKLLFYVTSSHH